MMSETGSGVGGLPLETDSIRSRWLLLFFPPTRLSLPLRLTRAQTGGHYASGSGRAFPRSSPATRRMDARGNERAVHNTHVGGGAKATDAPGILSGSFPGGSLRSMNHIVHGGAAGLLHVPVGPTPSITNDAIDNDDDVVDSLHRPLCVVEYRLLFFVFFFFFSPNTHGSRDTGHGIFSRLVQPGDTLSTDARTAGSPSRRHPSDNHFTVTAVTVTSLQTDGRERCLQCLREIKVDKKHSPTHFCPPPHLLLYQCQCTLNNNKHLDQNMRLCVLCVCVRE